MDVPGSRRYLAYHNNAVVDYLNDDCIFLLWYLLVICVSSFCKWPLCGLLLDFYFVAEGRGAFLKTRETAFPLKDRGLTGAQHRGPQHHEGGVGIDPRG